MRGTQVQHASCVKHCKPVKSFSIKKTQMHFTVVSENCISWSQEPDNKHQNSTQKYSIAWDFFPTPTASGAQENGLLSSSLSLLVLGAAVMAPAWSMCVNQEQVRHQCICTLLQMHCNSHFRNKIWKCPEAWIMKTRSAAPRGKIFNLSAQHRYRKHSWPLTLFLDIQKQHRIQQKPLEYELCKKKWVYSKEQIFFFCHPLWFSLQLTSISFLFWIELQSVICLPSTSFSQTLGKTKQPHCLCPVKET